MFKKMLKITLVVTVLFVPIINVNASSELSAIALSEENAETISLTDINSLPDTDSILSCTYNEDMELSNDQLIIKYRDYSIEDIRMEYDELGKDPTQVDAIIQKCPRLTYVWKFTDEEMQLFQRMVYAESGNQDEKTQKIVASVILNRISSELFPSTLEEVCYQKGQFEVVSNGDYLNKTPSENTIRIVEEVCKNGISTDSDILFFRNYYYHEGYTDAFVSGVLYFSKV